MNNEEKNSWICLIGGGLDIVINPDEGLSV